MKGLLIHGCYNLETFEVLKGKGVSSFSFDLRARSPQLITFNDLHLILSKVNTEKLFLTFENDSSVLIKSALDILGIKFRQFSLIFRDQQAPEFYRSLPYPSYWVYQPHSDWKKILGVLSMKGVFLPLKYTNHYQTLPELWEIIEERGLKVYLQADNFDEADSVDLGNGINLSIDLSFNVEHGYRPVNLEVLNNMKVWSRFHENTAGQ